MLNVGEVELKCDMAEAYHLFITEWDDPPLPFSYLADLAFGLNDDSRIKKKLSGNRLTFDQTFQALTVDALHILAWQNTKDGHKGRNVPESIYKKLAGLEGKKKDELRVFDSIEDFQEWYERTHHV